MFTIFTIFKFTVSSLSIRRIFIVNLNSVHILNRTCSIFLKHHLSNVKINNFYYHPLDKKEKAIHRVPSSSYILIFDIEFCSYEDVMERN